MDITIATSQQVEELKSKLMKKDWSEVYNSLDTNRKIIVDTDSSVKQAVYQHYKKLGQKVHVMEVEYEKKYLIWLDE